MTGPDGRLLRLAAVYVVLLAGSTGVRLVRSVQHRGVPSGQRAQAVRRTGSEDGPPVDVAYRESGPDAFDGTSPTEAVLLLHGGRDAEVVSGLVTLLSESRRSIVPDLPGFGASTRRIRDSSLAFHASTMNLLLDSLGVRRVHLVGVSTGGGVALEMVDERPERVASLTLWSAGGAREFEVLGDRHIDRAIHALRLLAVRGLVDWTPHFGLLDARGTAISHARLLFDTDARPLRGILERLDVPTLIVHRQSDPLAPVETAYEHARIVPQAELVLRYGGPSTAVPAPTDPAGPVRAFLSRVDAGEALTRRTAEPERVAASRRPFDHARPPGGAGPVLLSALLLLGLATLVSEDLASLGAGVIAAQGSLPIVPAIVACVVGVWVGDFGLYALGRWVGRPALAAPPFRWFVSTDRLSRAGPFFDRRPAVAIIGGRFVPGLRLPTYVAAGAVRMSVSLFLAWTAVAVLLWTPALVSLGWLIGRGLVAPGDAAGAVGLLPWVAVAVWTARRLARLASWRGRRLLLGDWRRWTRFEFWPTWLVYTPVVVYVVWLAIRHRSLTLFTLANPGIPLGGLAGEPKDEILAGLARSEPDAVPATRRVEPGRSRGQALGTVRAFLSDHGLGLPVVCKPNVGERGSGVVIAHTLAAAADYLTDAPGPVLLQEYQRGHEFGVSWYRLPGQPRGRIFSITDKRLPELVGDGRSALSDLLLADDRHVVTARRWLTLLGERGAEIPGAGERVVLSEVANHSRGTAFLEGEDLRTPALEESVDRLGQSAPGFHIGRFDLRAPTREDFVRGRNLRVIEINGVAGEPGNIYAPGYGLLRAWMTLCRHWRLVFEIGAAHRRAGLRPAGPIAVTRALFRHRGTLAGHPPPHLPPPVRRSRLPGGAFT